MCACEESLQGEREGMGGGLARGRALENALNGDGVDVAADDMMR